RRGPGPRRSPTRPDPPAGPRRPWWWRPAAWSPRAPLRGIWDKAKYETGKSQPSFDKHFVRDYLLARKWNKKPPAPELPDEIINGTSEKYLQALKVLAGESLS
ncbi:MAG: phosphoribosylaminoimidazolesuccinocarboxamide synthase, partial [Candidatus Kryptoniota bacterium]